MLETDLNLCVRYPFLRKDEEFYCVPDLTPFNVATNHMRSYRLCTPVVVRNGFLRWQVVTNHMTLGVVEVRL